MISRRHLMAAALPALGCAKKASNRPRGVVFVATVESHAIAVVDLGGFALIRSIALDAPVTSLTLGEQLYAISPAASSVCEVDAKEYRVRRRLRLPGEPVAMSLSDDRKRLLVLLRGRPALALVDPEAFRVVSQIPLARDPVAFSTRGTTAAITTTNGWLVTADLGERRMAGQTQLSTEVGGVSIRSDGKRILVGDRAQRQLVMVDTATRQVVVRLPLAIRPDHWCEKADGGQVFLTGEGHDAVVIAYPYRAEIGQTHLSGRAPGAMAVSTGPDYLFVANPVANSVTIFDIDTQRVLAVTGVGSKPSSILVTPDQQYALVLNEDSGDMAVIRTAAITPGRAKQAPLFTMIPVGARPVSATFRVT